MLGFDVPTFVFQIVNFLILLAILARFFYRPVLEVMRRRQEQIDSRIEDAEQRARLADEERERLARQSEAASREAAALVEAARNEAARERQRLLQAAKQEAASLIDEARKTATAEEQAALGRLSGRLSESAVKIAGALIRETSGEAVHQSLVARLIAEGLGLDTTARQQARLDFQKDASRLVVESAYPLDSKQQAALLDEVARTVGRPAAKLRLEVHEDPELIAGVRLVAGAIVIDMSVKHLLEELSRLEGGL
jgi:F-type H+-transporting ATPase subunit b